ncbi:hypothetical protein [Elizabethkingia anophelis]|uniref:hypothetical protein n=1 Tax=Elizabethkingia anophelis TaxID=1117645 RepID=UPI001623380C|nr:hypothetical protein [Elizabethkingia anophelis]UKY88766.1 hypothetical protein KUF64_10710 [Elizabethkingia anophelis]UKY95936.1 hypothetical protein KUF68_10730 [Elizabethkingia anophelis]
MLDNVKLEINQRAPEIYKYISEKLLTNPDFRITKPPNNNYTRYSHKNIGNKLCFDFRKVQEKGNLIGYREIYITLTPHYYFNNNKHNGNDLTPENCIKTILNILNYLGIKKCDFHVLKVVNIEFGLNIIPEHNIEDIINGLLYFNKTKFITPNSHTPYYKITESSGFKQIKAYAKGLQFQENPEFGIDHNTFRFEIKSKQSKSIKLYGIYSVQDLIQLNTYKKLSQELINGWDKILIINQAPDFRNLKSANVQFIKNAKKARFWQLIKEDISRNKFSLLKQKYYDLLEHQNNIHQLIKLKIIDKLVSFQNNANST